MRIHSPTFVTRPDLPPLEAFMAELEGLWQSRQLTNHGPLVERFEQAVAEALDVPFVASMSHGTSALMVAFRALELEGEVITTPFSFPATAHALHFLGLTPVFVDVEPETLTLDPARIEAAITPRTSAIVPVHTYGVPCDADAIDAVARAHDLRVVYDAAPAFGVECHCGSVLSHGDLSVLSFHATKVMHTLEGGAVISHDPDMHARLRRLSNFGYAPDGALHEVGINAKMNELQAALGLLQLERVDQAIEARGRLVQRWHEGLTPIPGLDALDPSVRARRPNHGYLPVRVGDDYPLTRDELWGWMRSRGVEPRRYYTPLLSDLEPYRDRPGVPSPPTPIAADAAQRMLCLPLYPDLAEAEVDRILALLAAPGGR
jgi:dTDP-4-amino-4,6-dideoxygalactose transaminase